MKFSVIYTMDCPRYEIDNSGRNWGPYRISNWLPSPGLRTRFKTTEWDAEQEYDYLGEEWYRHRHRKLVGLLTKTEFEDFLRQTGLFAEDVETGGMLGAPGVYPWYGWAPAISFRSDDPIAIQGAYVCPLPELCNVRPEELDEDGEVVEAFSERDWERVRRVVIDVYRNGVL